MIFVLDQLYKYVSTPAVSIQWTGWSVLAHVHNSTKVPSFQWLHRHRQYLCKIYTLGVREKQWDMERLSTPPREQCRLFNLVSFAPLSSRVCKFNQRLSDRWTNAAQGRHVSSSFVSWMNDSKIWKVFSVKHYWDKNSGIQLVPHVAPVQLVTMKWSIQYTEIDQKQLLSVQSNPPRQKKQVTLIQGFPLIALGTSPASARNSWITCR